MGIKTVHGTLSWPGLANPSCSPQPLDAPGLPTATARGWGQKTFPPGSPKPLPWLWWGKKGAMGRSGGGAANPPSEKKSTSCLHPLGNRKGGREVQLGRVGPGPGGGGMGAGLSEWGFLGYLTWAA